MSKAIKSMTVVLLAIFSSASSIWLGIKGLTSLDESYPDIVNLCLMITSIAFIHVAGWIGWMTGQILGYIQDEE